MKKMVVSLLAGALVVVGASPASASASDPDLKRIIEWLKDPCVPTGDLENDCQLPWG